MKRFFPQLRICEWYCVIIPLTSFFNIYPANAQIIWQKIINSNDIVDGQKVVHDRDNNVYVLTNYYFTGSVLPVYLIKYSSAGVELFRKKIPDSYPRVNAMKMVGNDIVLCGMEDSEGYILSLNTNGDINWVTHQTGINYQDITSDVNHEIIIACGAVTLDSANNYRTMIRVDQFSFQGDLQWSFSSSDSDYYTSGNAIMNIISANNGNAYVFGTKGETESNPVKIFVLALNRDGVAIKNIEYSEDGFSYGTSSSSVALDGSLFIGGVRIKNGVTECFILKLDALGNTVWIKQYPVYYGFGISAMFIDAKGGLLISGMIQKDADADVPFIDYISADGSVQWHHEISGEEHCIVDGQINIHWAALDVQFTDLGYTYFTGLGCDYNVETGILDANGKEIWNYHFNENSIPRSIVVNDNSDIIICGQKLFPYSSGCFTVKIQNPIEEIHEDIGIFAFPDPFTTQTLITIVVSHPFHASFRLLDILGREIVTIPDLSLTEGTNTLALNASELAAGSYFAVFDGDTKPQCAQLIHVR